MSGKTLSVPEFSADEMNNLTRLGRQIERYESIRQLVLSEKPLNEKQIKLLWAVKNELKEE